MPVYLSGKKTCVNLIHSTGEITELAVPIETDRQWATAAIWVADVGRKVVFVEFIRNATDKPFNQGEAVRLEIIHGDDPANDIKFDGILDVVSLRSKPDEALKGFVVVVEVPALTNPS